MTAIRKFFIVALAALCLPIASWSIGGLSKKKAEEFRSAKTVRIEVESQVVKHELEEIAAHLLSKYGDFAVVIDSQAPSADPDEDAVTLKVKCKGEDVEGVYLMATPHNGNRGQIVLNPVPDDFETPVGAEIEGEVTIIKSGKKLYKGKFSGYASPPLVSPGSMNVGPWGTATESGEVLLKKIFPNADQQFHDTNEYKSDPYVRAMAAEDSYVQSLLALLADIFGREVYTDARLDSDSLVRAVGARILAKEKKAQWKFYAGGLVFSKPAIHNQEVLFGSWDGNFYAADMSSGREKWKFKTEGRIVSNPLISEEVVYFGDEDHYIYALDAVSGKEIWKYQADAPVTSSPALINGLILCGSGDGIVHAVDAKSGQPVWKFATSGAVSKTPVASGDTVFLGYGDNVLYAIGAATGATIWRVDLSSAIASPLSVHDGVLYLGCMDDRLHALSTVSGKEIWTFPTYGVVYSGSAVANGIVYFGSADCFLYAVDAASGEEEWHFGTRSRVYATPVVRDGVVYCTSQDHNLYAVDASGGYELWRFVTGGILWASLAAGDDVVFVGSDDKYLYAIDTKISE